MKNSPEIGDNVYSPHGIQYNGKDVDKIRIQPCFEGKRRLPYSKVTLLTATDARDFGETVYAGFHEAYMASSVVQEIRDLLKRKPWGEDNGGITREHTFYENWLKELFG